MAKSRKRYAIAKRKTRRGPSRPSMKLVKRAASATKRASALRQQYATPMGAAKTGALVLGGAALGGAVNAAVPQLAIMGAEPDAALALILVGAAFASKKPSLVYMAAGIGAAYAREWAQDMTEQALEGGSIVESITSMGGQ